MNPGAGTTSGQFGEIGWTDAQDEEGRLDRAVSPAVLLGVVGAYWVVTWIMSGLAPLAYLAGRVGDIRHRE
jgi:hypothetical protein